MPVIRGEPSGTALSCARRSELVQNVMQELSGNGAPGGPVIFEIPLDKSRRFDVVVVWDAFDSLLSEDRISLILDAYGDRQERVAQALGVTYQEALEQHLLPYAVVPMARPGETNAEDIRTAMLAEGGFERSTETIDLRFPTMAMAEAAHRRLCDTMPKGYWSIVQATTAMA